MSYIANKWRNEIQQNKAGGDSIEERNKAHHYGPFFRSVKIRNDGFLSLLSLIEAAEGVVTSE